jgi:hypothetical protein
MQRSRPKSLPCKVQTVAARRDGRRHAPPTNTFQPPPMRVCIMLTGVAGSGKSTLATIIPKVLAGPWREVAFADPLKVVCHQLAALWGADVALEDFYDPVTKETALPGLDHCQAKTPRQVMQRVGTDILRAHLGPDVFVRAALHNLATGNPKDNVIVTDVRFDNEAALRDDPGLLHLFDKVVMVRVVRPGAGSATGASHQSEQGLSEAKVDVTITNDGTLEDLQLRFGEAMAAMGLVL